MAYNMDNTNAYDAVVSQHTFINHTANMMGAAYESTQPDGAAFGTFFSDYSCRPDGFMYDVAAAAHPGGEFQGLYSSPPYVCAPSGHFSSVAPPLLVNRHGDRDLYSYQSYSPQYRAAPQTPPCVPFSGPRPSRQWGDDREQRHGAAARTESGADLQRKRDAQWLRGFSRNKTASVPPKPRDVEPDLKAPLYRAARLVAQLEACCGTLTSCAGDSDAWTGPHSQALSLKKELEAALAAIDGGDFDTWKSKVHRKAERRRSRKRQQDAERRRQERISEKEAAIDAWRLRRIRGVEEKKKERELKLAADAVLCEVRKKQADVKRMQDILRSLLKLHKLRKEAALRKGITIERRCEEAFSGRLDQLSSVMKVRTSVYAAEEKALKVMIEGEHEEEKRRDREKQMKKEKEKLLLKKRMVDALLFGEFTADAAPQPFIDYYTQAECSVNALLHIRSEWDLFAVAADHPDASSIPQNWIMPDQPSDEAWASALQPVGSG